MDMNGRSLIVFFSIGYVLGCLTACSDPPDETDHNVVSIKQPRELPSWLTVKDTMEPSVWLRSREVGHEILPTDPEVERIRRAMNQASTRFIEDPRMIANRTAQTGEILAEDHKPERYVDIMTGMIDVADTTISKKLFGEMCQHYLNVRKTGMDRGDALKSLIASYKTESSLR